MTRHEDVFEDARGGPALRPNRTGKTAMKRRSQRGASLLEHALLCTVLALFVSVSATRLGVSISAAFGGGSESDHNPGSIDGTLIAPPPIPPGAPISELRNDPEELDELPPD